MVDSGNAFDYSNTWVYDNEIRGQTGGVCSSDGIVIGIAMGSTIWGCKDVDEEPPLTGAALVFNNNVAGNVAYAYPIGGVEAWSFVGSNTCNTSVPVPGIGVDSCGSAVAHGCFLYDSNPARVPQSVVDSLPAGFDGNGFDLLGRQGVWRN